MYYQIYNINDSKFTDIKILRFSYNKFQNFLIYDTDENNNIVSNFLIFLQSEAVKYQECYKSLEDWHDYSFFKNGEIIIAFNINTFHIQGWCNIKYEKTSNDEFSYYTLLIEKIITREKPKIKNIGSILLYFIKYMIFDNVILFIDIGDIKQLIKLNIFYLYSITSSINFYKKIPFLIHLSDIKNDFLSIETQKIHEHVFFCLNNEVGNLVNKYTKILSRFHELHYFDAKTAFMNKKEIEQFSSYIAPENCIQNNNKSLFHKYYYLIHNNMINFNINQFILKK